MSRRGYGTGFAAEELGYDEFWVGEHHTGPWEPIVSPEMFIAAVFRKQAYATWSCPNSSNLITRHRWRIARHFWTTSHMEAESGVRVRGSPADFSKYDRTWGDAVSLSEAMGVILKIWTLMSI
ncbi:MAG: hypothetical protein CM1200mP39_19930 [Dehalococcoidia bacterium]|nr:MAG: hypothetical protein CM1200mP39_19930 [Dehalococcoidia bacterium]